MNAARLVTVAALAALAGWWAGCGAVEDVLDPVHAQAVAALPPDTSGFRNGPMHRPGQPCLTCHGDLGPAHPEMSVGGTVYETQPTTVALDGAVVSLTDDKGTIRTLTTNRTGNFFVSKDDWAPVYPMRVSVAFGGVSIDMKTHVGRDGSCADCHTDPAGPASAGHVYLVLDPADFPGAP